MSNCAKWKWWLCGGVVGVVGVSLFIGLTSGCGGSAAPEGLQDSLTPVDQTDQVAKLEDFWLKSYEDGLEPVEKKIKEVYSFKLLAKAQPDECFNGIGEAYPPGPPCSEGQSKVNHAYVWGLAKSGSTLWFGTAPNVLCLVFGGFHGITQPIQTDSWVCEFGQSQIAKANPNLPPEIGDWRPSDIFTYNTATKQLTEITNLVNDPQGKLLLNTTLGLRSAGAYQGVVILGGPGLLGGVNLFAFNTQTGAYIGSYNLAGYSNIRKWVVIQDVLYTAVKDTPVNGTSGGKVLRWNGTVANPFQFEVVGSTDSEGAELAEHNGRIFVSTWPGTLNGQSVVAGIWMSPVIPQGGLTSADTANWVKVFRFSDYDPDPVTAMTYGGGALASFQGYLYWGTMHVPFVAALTNFEVYGQPADAKEAVAIALGTHRAITIFRSQFAGPSDSIVQVCYGMPTLPVFNPTTRKFVETPNKIGLPLYGKAGFGNYYNNYTWTMGLYKGQLFVGTMDWSYLLADGLINLILEQATGMILPHSIRMPHKGFGADLWSFTANNLPARPVNTDGIGNYANYGIRTMLSDDYLYLGSANPMNLMTKVGDKVPQGGWELIKMSIDQWKVK